jgi:glycosyltransferase involved in cell wall biosynthesis
VRVVFLSWRDLAHPQAGGAEVVVDRLATGLLERGHAVTVLSGGPVSPHPYRVFRSGGRYSQYLLAPWRFHRHVRRTDVVVDIESGVPYFSPLWQRAPVVGLVHHVHTDQWSMYFPAPVAGLGRWIEGWLMPHVYRRVPMVAVSGSTAEALGALGFDRQLVSVVEMAHAPPVASGARAAEPRFVVLGRLVPHKRVELALEAWEKVRPVTGGELVIVGDGPMRTELEAMAGPGVRFTGFVDEATKGAELTAAWLLVHPAHHEGWGAVVMEAAGLGVPTVAFDVVGVRDSVRDGVTGLLADNVDGLAAAWIRLATNHVLRESMSHEAQAWAGSFTWEASVDAFEQVLTDVVSSRRRSATPVGGRGG